MGITAEQFAAASVYGSVKSGELAGVTSATRLPSVTCAMVAFRAAAANTGKVYIGGAGVTKVDGTTDTTTGMQLSAGEWTPYLFVANLNVFYRICDGAGDALTYLAFI